MAKPASMTLQQLRDLVAVVTHGGFRAAARALDVSQAGLTKSLAKLEDEHGVSLLERKAKGVGLTPHGEDFFHHAQALLLEAERAEEWLHATRGKAAASVTLGVSIEPSLQFVPAVLVDYRRAMPDVTLFLTQSVASELVTGVRENRLEFAVTRLPAKFDAADLRVDLLCDSESAIVGRKGHPCAQARSIRHLVNQEWVVLGNRELASAHDESIRGYFSEHQIGPPPRIAAVTDSLFGAISILLESDCLARLPKVVLRHALFGKMLMAIPLQEPPRHSNIALIQKSSHRLTREAQKLASMLSSFVRISQAIGQQQTVLPTAETDPIRKKKS